MTKPILLPEFCLVLLIGPSGSGKTTFAQQHFLDSEIISSDQCRKALSDDENDQSITKDAFELVHFILGKRLQNKKLTVIDATNAKPEDRRQFVALARHFHCAAIAIVLNVNVSVCVERNTTRTNRKVPEFAVRNQAQFVRKSISRLKEEGFRDSFVFQQPEEIENIRLERVPLQVNKLDETGPFDIIGDVHGCATELEELLEKLGYERKNSNSPFVHPQQRKAFFVGDLMDRGPRNLDVYRLVSRMVHSGNALCVLGNHDLKLQRKLAGKNVTMNHGIQETWDEIESLASPEKEQTIQEMNSFLRALASHYVLDKGRLVVAHAGLREELQGRISGKIRSLAVFGETTGEKDEWDLPVRTKWALNYEGKALVVFGHTPLQSVEWCNHTINIDTGCVFGGQLTAFRYPEREIVQVPSHRMYCEPTKPLQEAMENTHSIDLPSIQSLLGKKNIETKLFSKIIVTENQFLPAMETLGRFGVHPNWLVYIPPTMSPPKTSEREDYLEHPQEVFDFYRNQGIQSVVCQAKHMGSRAIMIVCKDKAVTQKRFRIQTDEIGCIYTRTGRAFFKDSAWQTEILSRVHQALSQANFWEDFNSDWFCLDCEILPWSTKAQELISNQYASVGIAGKQAIDFALTNANKASQRGLDIEATLQRLKKKKEWFETYTRTYRGYCWKVESVADLKIAPFHLLACENQVLLGKNHLWHLETLEKLIQQDPYFLVRTPYQTVDLHSETEIQNATTWWSERTEQGEEGMVVKPLESIAFCKERLVQPAVKCRGRNYLQIIYGPEYLHPEFLQKVKVRSLKRKSTLALKEFSLGYEALESFVQNKSLNHVHQLVLAVLALETDPIDPRL